MGLFLEVNCQPQPIASASTCFTSVHPRAFVGKQGAGHWWCPKLWHLAVGEREKPYSSKQPNQLVQSPLKPWGRSPNVVVAVSRFHWHLMEINPRITTVPLKIPLLTLKRLGYGSAASVLAKTTKSQKGIACKRGKPNVFCQLGFRRVQGGCLKAGLQGCTVRLALSDGVIPPTHPRSFL